MQVLARAREIIADPKNWVQGEYSTDRTGAPVAPFDEDACCFCIIGAVDRAVAEHIGLQVVAHDYEEDLGAGIAALEDHELRPNPRGILRERIARRERLQARFDACACLLLFVVALGAGLSVETISEGGRVLLVVLAFVALVAGQAAASEA